MDSFEHKGIWWLPEDLENEHPGTLSFDPINGGHLEVIKPLSISEPFFEQYPRGKIDIIQGIVQGSPVTLRGCCVTKTNFSTPGFSEAQIRVNYIYMGHHFDKVKDIVFEKLSVRYTHLDEWANQSYFKINRTPDNRLDSISYIPSKPTKIQLDKYDIEFWGSYNSEQTRAEFSIKNIERITITSKEECHFDSYLEFINSYLPNFLTLATGHTNYPFDIRGIISDKRSSIGIYYRILGYRDKPRSISPREMLFTFEDIKADLSTYLPNWISKSEKLWPVYDEYFKHYYSRYIDTKSQFLSYTRALEAYHRNVHDGVYLTPEEYKPIENQLIETIRTLQIEKSHKEKLKNMVKYGYEFSLRKRIKNLCDDTLSDKGIIEGLLGKSKDFANKVTVIRNYLTHNPKDQSENAIPNDELFDYIRKMQMLLRLCFLVEIGFSPNEIKRLMNDYDEYKALTEKQQKA